MKYIEILAVEKKPISPFNVEDVLANPKYAKKAWDTWKATPLFQFIETAKKYYNNDNPFITEWKRNALYTAAAGKNAINTKGAGVDFINREDEYKSHIKMKHPLFQDMINQIAGFILNNRFILNTDKKEIKELRDELENEFDLSMLLKLQTKEHLIKGYSGTNFKFDEMSNIEVQPIPAEAFGFFFNETTSQKPEYIIMNSEIENSFFDDEANGGKGKWKTMKSEKITIITANQIIVHSKNPETKLWETIDNSFTKSTKRKLQDREEILKQEVIDLQMLPFSILTTQTLSSSLHKVKDIIDALDINTTDAMQELINLIKNLWIIKGADGTSTSEALDLIKAGVLTLDEDASAENLQGFEAVAQRISMSDSLKESFYRFAKVVDLEKLKALSNTSSVSIKALYESLNQESKDIETGLKNYIIDLLKKFYKMKNIDKSIDEINDLFKGLSVEFKHDMISNINEDLTANALQMGKIDEMTRLKNHPWMADKTEDEINEILKSGIEEEGTEDGKDKTQTKIPKKAVKNK